MNRFFACLFVSISISHGALAQGMENESTPAPETEATPAERSAPSPWEGVYERSSRTIKAGEYMGIFGGTLTIIGGTVAIIGGVNVLGGGIGSLLGNEGAEDRAAGGASTVVIGAATGLTGFAAFQVGPAVMTAGALRQAKAIRQVNPSAPSAWVGYCALIPWAAGLNPGLASLILQPTAYVIAGIQKGKNRLYWDARSSARLERSNTRVTYHLTPISIEGNRGLALTGQF